MGMGEREEFGVGLSTIMPRDCRSRPRRAMAIPTMMTASAEKRTMLEAFQERIQQPLRSFIRASRHESQIRPVMKRSIAITRHSPRPDTAIGQVDADPSAV